MNKKFSTLMAIALVAGSVSAQNWGDTGNSTLQGAYRTFETKSVANNPAINMATGNAMSTGAAWSKNVNAIDASLWYQLEVEDNTTDYADVLIQERDYETGKVYLRVVSKEEAPLNASLWQIKYSKPDGVSGGYFTYINKETGLALTLDHSAVPADNKTITELRAGTAEWSWYTVNETNSTPFGFEKIYSYLHDQRYNQVMYLAYAVDNDASEIGTTVDGLKTKLVSDGFKFAASTGKFVKAKVVKTADAGDKLQNLTDVLTFKPVLATPFFMTAKQFNTRMDADDKMNDKTFEFVLAPKDLVGSDVFAGKFTAEENIYNLQDNSFTGDYNGATAGDDASLKVITNKFNLSFKNGDKYLRPALARYQEDLQPSKSPAVKFELAAKDAEVNVYLKARHYFRATYFPTNDSIVIEPLNAAVQSDDEFNAGTTWAASKCCTSFYRNDYTKANSLVNDDAYTSKTVSITTADIPGEVDAITVAKDAKNEFKAKVSIVRPFEYLNRATKETGLYFINLANHSDRQRAEGMNIVKNMAGDMMYDTEAMNQRYNLMPATMWTVQQLGCAEMGKADSAKYVRIQNREYPGIVFEGQLYSKDGKTYQFIDRSIKYQGGYDASSGMFEENFLQVADLITFTPVTDPVAYTSTHGYKMFTKDELNNGIENNYNIKWNNFLNDNLFVQSDKDVNSYIDEATAPVFYEIAEATWPTNAGIVENTFGSTLTSQADDAATATTTLDELNRKAYIIKVKDKNLIDNNQLYIASVKATDGRYYYKAVKKSELNNVDKKLAYFYFKADQVRLDDKNAILDTCYVLVDIAEPATKANAPITLHTDNGWMKVAVEAGYKMGVLRDNDLNDKPNDVSDAFYTTHEIRPQYIDLANDKDYKIALNSNIKIYQQLATKNYLFEDGSDANNVHLIQPIKDGFHYLGIESKTIDANAALYVDEVVNDYELMQRYLLGVRVDSIPDGWICNDKDHVHGYWDKEAMAEDDGLAHFSEYKGYTAGWFLVNLEDSITDGKNNMMDDADLYKFNNYTRLGFVEGIHQVDGTKETLYIVQPGYTLDDLMTIKDNGSHAKYTKAGYVLDPAKLADSKYVKAHDIAGSLNTNHTFSLRKTNTYADGTYDKTASEPFLLESHCDAVAAFTGQWVKTENGIPVLAKLNTATGNHEDGGSVIAEQIGQSGVFYFETTTEEATDNDEIAVSSINVLAKAGSVEIIGAAGKKVVISNILGQVIANEIITSDDAVIAVPAGMIIVSVEGEEAVKTIVK